MRTLVGVVTGTKLDKHEERIAWLLPLVDATGSAWKEISEPEEEFPERGYIFWPRATGAEKGHFFHFHAKENTVRREGGDEFTAVDVRPVYEVLDLRPLGSPEQVRAALSSGIRLPGLPVSRALVWCRGNQAVGPVSLVTGPDGSTMLEKKDRARIRCFEFADGEIRQLSYEDSKRNVVATPTLGAPHSFVDWDEDRQVLKRAVEYAVRSSAQAQLDSQKKLIEEAVEHLMQNGSSAELRLELYRLNRGLQLVSDLKLLQASSAEVVAALQKHPAVVKGIEEVKEFEREQARSDADAALKEEREALEGVKKKRGERVIDYVREAEADAA